MQISISDREWLDWDETQQAKRSESRVVLPEELEDPLDLALKPLPNVCGSWHHPSEDSKHDNP